ncbi:MAG: hypothetical protein GY745_00265 [Actinomycetia bacterium]|nr:hypothetical protein [Actinomycetes bacterium]
MPALALLAVGCGSLPPGPAVTASAGETAADGGVETTGTTVADEASVENDPNGTAVATIVDSTTSALDPSAADPQAVAVAAVAVADEMALLEFLPIDAGDLAVETCPGIPSPDVLIESAGLARSRFARDEVVGPFIDYSARSFTSAADASEWVETLKAHYVECEGAATVIEGRELPSTRSVDVPAGTVANVDQIEGFQNEVFFTEARQKLFVVIQSVVTRRGPYVTVVSFTGGGPSTPDAVAGLASYATTKLPT